MKPPYRVPSMSEISSLPWNGFNVVSTFSGCGGSSLGYRMAGFRVLLASEFIEAARKTYQANAASYTKLDGRDIREVSAEDILEQIGLDRGDLDLFDGSPPCAAFSTAGVVDRGWGEVRKYSDTKQRVDDLFFEYARLVEGLQPKTFVAENVSGLVKGKSKGYFNRILARLSECGYRVGAKVLDAQWLGVPQMRKRLIFVGVRYDLGLDPVFPKPLPYRYSVRDAIPWIDDDSKSPFPIEPECDISAFSIGRAWDETPIGTNHEKRFSLAKPHPDGPANTVTAIAAEPSMASVVHPLSKRKFSVAELRRLCGFPDDFVLVGDYRKQVERLGRAVPPVMMSHIAAEIRDRILRRLTR